ncbi:DUF4349 domain-containing protein [Paenibacillus koleovorans]|uniref:DUF4349 domain-containing protein n=1 Tax=Paenibacillus koleovorans TaxID=121608 RepID=UPI000FDBD1EF|nr:DUF4349 domain-containing protein [Paenibacillus koleovorans]
MDVGSKKVEERKSSARAIAGKWWKVGGIALVLAVGIGLTAGCSSGSEDKASVAPIGAMSDSALSNFGENAINTADAKPQSGEVAPAGGSTALSKNATSAAKAQTAATQTAPSGMSLANSAGAFDRQIIYKANITMEVTSYGDAQSEIKNMALLAGGYIVQFSENRNTSEQSGMLTVKVPSTGFTGFVADLEKMKPKSMQQSIQGQDVTEEFVDLASRLTARQAVETRLLDFLSKATKPDDLISYSNEIGRVQEEIEKIKGRMKYLEQNVAYSTVEIRLYEKLPATKKLAEEPEKFFARIGNTAETSASAMLTVLQGLLLFLAGALPVLTVLAVIALPIALWLRKRRQSQKLQQQRAQALREDNRRQAAHTEPLVTDYSDGDPSV